MVAARNQHHESSAQSGGSPFSDVHSGAGMLPTSDSEKENRDV